MSLLVRGKLDGKYPRLTALLIRNGSLVHHGVGLRGGEEVVLAEPITYYLRLPEDGQPVIPVGSDPVLALKALREQQAHYLDPEPELRPRPRQTERVKLTDAVRTHLETVKRTRSTKTWTKDSGSLAAFLESCRVEYLDEVGQEDIDLFFQARATRYPNRNTRSNYMEGVRHFFRKCRIDSDTVSFRGLVTARTRANADSFTEEEITKALLYHAGNVVTTAWLRVYADGGLRDQEGARLRIGHVNTRTSALMLTDGTKFGKHRNVEMNSEAMAAIRALIELQDNDPEAFLFPTEKGTVDAHMERVSEAIFSAAGVSLENKKPMHSLRYFHACHLHANGWSAEEIRVRLGHKDIATTQFYISHMDLIATKCGRQRNQDGVSRNAQPRWSCLVSPAGSTGRCNTTW